MLEVQFAQREFTTAGETITATEITPLAKVLDYVPADAAPETAYTPGPVEGAWPVRYAYPNVTETLTLSTAGCAPTALRDWRGFLERARGWNAQFRQDMRTVIRVRDDARHDPNEWFESRLVGGRLEFSNSGGRVIRLTVERFPFWEGAWTAL